MAGQPKKRAKQQSEQPPTPPPDDESWARDLAKDLMSTPPPPVAAQSLVTTMTTVAQSDREFLDIWWREQMSRMEAAALERMEQLRMSAGHPDPLFARQARSFGGLGMGKDVAARLMGITATQLEQCYGDDYALGAAEVTAAVATNLVRIATSTNDRYAVKAVVEFLNRRGGEEWRPPAQKLEVSTQPKQDNLIDSKSLTFEERQALKAIILSASARRSAGVIVDQSGEDDA